MTVFFPSLCWILLFVVKCEMWNARVVSLQKKSSPKTKQLCGAATVKPSTISVFKPTVKPHSHKSVCFCLFQGIHSIRWQIQQQYVYVVLIIPRKNKYKQGMPPITTTKLFLFCFVFVRIIDSSARACVCMFSTTI